MVKKILTCVTLLLTLSSEFQLKFLLLDFFPSCKKESPMFWANLLFTCGWRWTWTSHPFAFFPQVKDQSEWMLLCPVCVCIFNERIIPSSQRMFILVCFACWFLYWVIPQHSPWLNELFMPPFWVYVLPLCEYF